MKAARMSSINFYEIHEMFAAAAILYNSILLRYRFQICILYHILFKIYVYMYVYLYIYIYIHTHLYDMV